MGLGSGDKFPKLIERRAGNDVSSPLVGRVVELASVSEVAEPGRGGERVFKTVASNQRCPPLPSFARRASRQAALPSPTKGEEAMWVELRMLLCRTGPSQYVRWPLTISRTE